MMHYFSPVFLLYITYHRVFITYKPGFITSSGLRVTSNYYTVLRLLTSNRIIITALINQITSNISPVTYPFSKAL